MLGAEEKNARKEKRKEIKIRRPSGENMALKNLKVVNLILCICVLEWRAEKVGTPVERGSFKDLTRLWEK